MTNDLKELLVSIIVIGCVFVLSWIGEMICYKFRTPNDPIRIVVPEYFASCPEYDHSSTSSTSSTSSFASAAAA